tara:strand:- start:1624 stop:1941 length:318 start_codon:yes stop_codon:yes gene_type:complete
MTLIGKDKIKEAFAKIRAIINSKAPVPFAQIEELLAPLDDGYLGELKIPNFDGHGVYILNMYKSTTTKDGNIESKVFFCDKAHEQKKVEVEELNKVLAWSETKTL